MATVNGYRLNYWMDRAAQIRNAYDDDPGAAHADEDALLGEFIAALADGLVSDASTAAAVLRAELLRHERVRWYS